MIFQAFTLISKNVSYFKWTTWNSYLFISSSVHFQHMPKFTWKYIKRSTVLFPKRKILAKTVMWNSDSEDWYSIIFVMVLKSQGEMILLVEFKMSKKDLGAGWLFWNLYIGKWFHNFDFRKIMFDHQVQTHYSAQW